MSTRPCAERIYNSSDFAVNGSTLDPCGVGDVDIDVNNGSNRPRGRRGRAGWAGKYRQCGFCNTNCVYNAIEIGFIIGIVANVIVVYRVWRDKKLRDPTFIAIACLALADAIFLIVNITKSFEDVILTVTCGYPYKIVSKPYYIFQSIAWFAANSHVALMAILRYVTIAYPLRSTIFLTGKRVVMASAFVWFLGFVLLGTVSLLVSYKYILPGRSEEFIIVLWTIVYFMPLCVTTVLHILKMFVVKSTTRETATESTKKAIRRMSKIVIIVIVFATILPLPRLINKIIRVTATARVYPSKEFGRHYSGIANLLFLINHFINPFMYGFLSKRFRVSIRQMCWCKKGKSEERSTDTADTPLSARRQNNISLDPVSPTNKNSFDSIESLEKRF